MCESVVKVYFPAGQSTQGLDIAGSKMLSVDLYFPAGQAMQEPLLSVSSYPAAHTQPSKMLFPEEPESLTYAPEHTPLQSLLVCEPVIESAI